MKTLVIGLLTFSVWQIAFTGYSQITYPNAIQAKFDSFQYIEFDSGQLGEDVPGFSDDVGSYVLALDLADLSSNVLIVRYPIAAGSGQNDFSGTHSFTGFAFLEGRETYNLDVEKAAFDLYLEQVTPSVISGFAFVHDTIDLEYDSKTAVTVGRGSYCYEFIDKKYGDLCDPACESSLQDLTSINAPQFCIGFCCGNSAVFQLPGIAYVDSGIGSNQIEFQPLNEFDFTRSDFNLLYYQDSFSTEFGADFFRTQRFEIPLFQIGDVNLDGEVNLLDVSPFVDCLTSSLFRFQCDIDGNQVVDLLDVPGFVDLVAGR